MLRKIYNVFLGLLTGFIATFYLNRLFEFLLASILLSNKVSLGLKGMALTVEFNLTNSHNIYTYAIIFISPLIAGLIMIELSSLFNRHIYNVNHRIIILLFQLFNIGYIIIDLLIGIISVILKGSISSEWIKLFQFENFSLMEQLLAMFFLFLLFFSYLNRQILIIRKNIPIIQKK